jgi:transmembrane sensor
MRFADGSTAIPSEGHQASLAVVDDTPKRVVVALARGGARFDVVPRQERVFSVRVGDVTISVLGTAFSVERVADRVGVTVTRGAVLVDWGIGARRLAAGDEGWFPPLVVSPSTGEEHAKETPKRAPPVRHGGALSDVMPPRPAARNESSPPPDDTGEREADGAMKLFADADQARLARRFEDGAALLRRLLREYPSDQRAPIAAFSLGRVLLGELARPAEAARAFEQARALAPDGPLAEDALAREAEAWSRAGDSYRARARAAEYLRAYPNGRRAAAVTDAARSKR